jgi:hypothetical protein
MHNLQFHVLLVHSTTHQAQNVNFAQYLNISLRVVRHHAKHVQLERPQDVMEHTLHLAA